MHQEAMNTRIRAASHIARAAKASATPSVSDAPTIPTAENISRQPSVNILNADMAGI